MSFDVLHQCGQLLYLHRLLVESDIHDSQYVALPGTDEFFERQSSKQDELFPAHYIDTKDQISVGQ